MKRRRFLEAAATAGVVTLAGCRTDSEDAGQSPGTPLPTESPTRTPERTPLPTEEPTRTQERTPLPTEEPTPTPTRTEQPSVGPPPSPEQGIVDRSRMEPVLVEPSPGTDVSGIVAGIEAGQILVFPPERYRWESPAAVTVDDWGIRCHPNTVFEVPAGVGEGDEAELLTTHSGRRSADNVLLERLTFDSPGRAAPGVQLGVRNRAYVWGLHYRMNGPTSAQWTENGVRAYVEDDEGVLRIDHYRQANNGNLGAYARGKSRVGIYVPRENDGTVHLYRPVLQGFPNNACYVSRQPGRVVVEEGTLVNNNVSAVRVSGGVEVYGTTVYIDVESYLDGPGVITGDAHNTRGVWGDDEGPGVEGGLVASTTFVLRSYRRCYGLVTMLDNPRLTVRDSKFVVEDTIDAVQADRDRVELVNCEFVGSSPDSRAGVGNITGSDNVVRGIDPGDVPVDEWCDAEGRCLYY